jgi:hypothetical protein
VSMKSTMAHQNRLYSLRLALVIFSSTLIWILCFIVVVLKEESSNNWFICVKKILRKYDLKEANNYLDNPIKKSRWISLVKSRVNDHWCTQLTTLAQLYKGLQYLSNHNSHWRMKCSTFSSAAPHSRHVGSVSFL